MAEAEASAAELREVEQEVSQQCRALKTGPQVDCVFPRKCVPGEAGEIERRGTASPLFCARWICHDLRRSGNTRRPLCQRKSLLTSPNKAPGLVGLKEGCSTCKMSWHGTCMIALYELHRSGRHCSGKGSTSSREFGGKASSSGAGRSSVQTITAPKSYILPNFRRTPP